METNHKSKHEKVFAPWFVQSVGKFDEADCQRLDLLHTPRNSQNVRQNLQQTLPNTSPSPLQQSLTNTCKPVNPEPLEGLTLLRTDTNCEG